MIPPSSIPSNEQPAEGVPGPEKTQPIHPKRRLFLRRITGGRKEFDHLLGDSMAQTQPVTVSKTIPAARLPGSAERTRPVRVDHRRGGLWNDAWYRLRHNPEGVFGLVVIALMLLIALFAEWIAIYPVREVHINQFNLPPFWEEQSAIGKQGSLAFPLGTDRMGRDLFSWAVIGTRTSMMVGIISAPMIALAGLLLGLLAGYAGGWVDNLLMRITDIFYAFPTLMVTILVILVLRDTPVGRFQNGLLLLFIAFLAVGWAGAARLVRGSVMGIKNAEYIEAAQAAGVPAWRIVFRHIMPNCLGPLLVWATLMVPQLILTEAILGYLQINMGPSGYREAFFDASWGGMIREGRSFIHVQPTTILIPAVMVGLVSVAFTFLGDALRDALDPSSQKVRSREG